MSTIRRTDSAAPDLADIARQSLEEAAVIAECFGLDRAIARLEDALDRILRSLAPLAGAR